MRVFIRTSGWAIWAARIARPVLPLVLLAVAFHYIGVMTSPVFVAAIFVAIALALVSLVLGLIGYVSIWYSGDAGWREASSGVIVGCCAILFSAFVVVTSAQNQTSTDVSTSPATTPILLEGEVRNDLPANPVNSDLFRLASTREYRISAAEGIALVEQAANSLGWLFLDQKRSGAAELHNFYESKTLIGFKDDVTVSTRATARLLIVNVRSASRYGDGDFGTNSRRIEQFLLKLDELVEQAQKQSAEN